MKTDREHADAVRDAIAALNLTIAEASSVGIEVRIDVHTRQTVGRPDAPFLSAAVLRLIS